MRFAEPKNLISGHINSELSNHQNLFIFESDINILSARAYNLILRQEASNNRKEF